MTACIALLTAPHLLAISQQYESLSSSPIRISGGVMAGNILSKVSPVYPQNGCAAHAFGAVVMVVVIGKDGRVKSAEVISGHPLLQQPYLYAAKQYTFKPYLLDGQPVEVQTTLALNPSINCGETQPAANQTEQSSADALSRPLRISGGVIAGNVLTKVLAKFPEEARAKHINGTVVTHVVIGKDGHIKSAEAVSGPDLLRAAYVDAIKQWIYKPYLVNGKPVEVETTITTSIQLNGGS
jgi:outer membrane biosynthesis protein TonB